MSNNRFFQKSDYIEEITEKEVDDFLSSEKLVGRVQSERVGDFYNMLSRIATGEKVELHKDVDYNRWDCKNERDVESINKLRDLEKGYLNHINKDILTSSRLLKAATALAYQFEKMMAGEPSVRTDDINEYLRNLFDYKELLPDNESATFGELIKMDFLFLRYMALLSKKKAFERKTGKLERSPQGNIHKYTLMESFDEIFHMDMTSIVLPNFRTKLAQKDVYVRSRFEKVERGQNIIIMIDDSGSMNDEEKKAMLKAALTLKLMDASDAHNIYIGTFETSLFGFTKVEKGTRFEELRSFIFLNKGGTDVNGCIKETIRQIKERRLMKRGGGHYDLSDNSFEVMVINDGQDHVDPSYHPAIKTHALCLKQTNDNLKNVCHRSGGTYFYIQGRGNE